MEKYFIHGNDQSQGGGKIHIGSVDTPNWEKCFCGHSRKYQHRTPTNFRLSQDNYMKEHGVPPRIEFNLHGKSMHHFGDACFRDDFCQKCYRELVKREPELLVDLLYND
jgi:hypothetical protein